MQAKSPSVSSGAENDLETTAELPVLDVAAFEAAAAAEARTSNTDTWIIPSAALPDSAADPAASAPVVAGAVAPTSPVVGDDKRTQLEVSLRGLADDLREVEERLKHKGERLSEIEKALAHANAERSVAEQRSQQLTADLAHARATIAATEARVAELQRGLEEREAANKALRSHDKEFEQVLASRDRALAGVQRDLNASRALAATYLESLQSTEGRRGIFQEISSSLYWEVDERDARIGRLEGELAAATGRAVQLESRLNDRTAHITKLEQEMSGLGVRVSEHAEALKDAVAERQSELAKVSAERTTLISTVNSLEAKLSEANSRNTELEAASRTSNSRAEEVEAANTVQRKRAEQLDTELAAVRTELQQRSVALQEASTERGELMAQIAAGDARIKELENRMSEQQEFVRVLQADSNASVARAKELEGDLRAAEDMVNRLEGDLRGRATRLDELEKTNREWRTTVEEARAALTDRDSLIRRLEEETANSAVLLGAIQQRLDSSGTHEIAPDGDKRLLIRAEGDSEVVHVLGRKTSVGRTPDNDLQIDAKYISRHHAVILAGPAHTIIEDLNSTNGVLVNGRRITRQTLKDGDAVVIGKTAFRFAVRAVGERRIQ